MRNLLPAVIIFVLSGGVSFSFEETRNLYLLHITKEGTNIVTTMHVRAESEDEARNQVVLNGWVVLQLEPAHEASVSEEHKFKYAGAGKPVFVGGGSVMLDDSVDMDLATMDGEGKTSDSDKSAESDVEAAAPIDVNMSPALLKDDNLTYLGSVHFDTGKYEAAIPAALAEKIEQAPADGMYLILGHTDTVGVSSNERFDTNFDLSRKRAEFLKSVLVKHGVSAVNISTSGMGTLMPADENTERGQIMNRRADLYERR
jgi:outer membrane protein OmpA-like peptidoglycan-associated protein